MQQGLLHLHNFMRWIVLLFALLTIIRGMRGMSGGKAFTGGDKKTAMFLMISCDIQLLLGLALYFMNNWFTVLTSGGDVMSNKYNRFYAVEHMFGMLVAIVLVHIGYASVKKNIADQAKFKKLFWYTLIAVVVIIATIPWPGRELIGRPLFPGMH
jgi:predicted Co/Zn/Cd cation transporter (cation efflux family)